MTDAIQTSPRRPKSFDDAVASNIGRSSLTNEAALASELPLVTNAWFETDIRQVLTDISQETGIRILWDRTVQGLVTYEAEEIPIDQVLAAILIPAGYAFRFLDGSYLVGSPDIKNPSFAHLSETQVLTIRYLPVDEAAKMLSDFFQPYIKVNPSDNTLCITAPPQLIKRILDDLKEIDQPQRQVMMEAIITDVSIDKAQKAGLDWSLFGTKDKKEFSVETDHTDIVDAALSGSYLQTAFALKSWTADVIVSLEALVESGVAKIRAKPRICTLNGHAATITIGKEQYFSLVTGPVTYPYTTLQSVSSGITLKITPFVSPLGEITVQIEPEVSDVIGEGKEGLPVISKRSAKTYIRVQEGETIAIGGLDFEQETKSTRKVPILGSIPLFGRLFRYSQTRKERSEIVILITPHVL